MKLAQRLLGGLLAAVMTISSFAAVATAASNTDGAYNVGTGIMVTADELGTDGVITLVPKKTVYDTADKKKGTVTFTDDGEKTTEKVIEIFGSSLTHNGVIDYIGTGKNGGTFNLPVNITSEGNYFAFVLGMATGTVNMWVDNTNATTATTAGAKQPTFAVTGTGGVAYAVDCGTLTAGKHTLTFDGAAGAWFPDICAVAVYPMNGDSFKLPYQNESLSFEERAADLVSRMTLDEKVAQLGHNAAAVSRLGVSAYYYWREAAHGVARQGKATSFPSSIAVSNTWDADLYEKAAEITSTEARIKNNRYNLNYWSPTINMSRDPRWGRNEESLGEDTLLTSALGSAFVRGMQGEDEKYIKTIATVKHFLANNCEGERQTGSSDMTESELRDYYAKAFANIVEATDPGAIMSSYNATTVTRNGEKLWDYLAMPANDNILTGYLRRSWGFTGFVTGDCGAVDDLNGNAFKRALFNYHGITETPLSSLDQSATVAYSIQAGNEMDCGSINTKFAKEAVEKGYLSEDEIDLAVYRIFLQRFKTGEFDDTDVFRGYTAEKDLETDESVAVAEKLAEESIVLLENSEDSEHNKLLPIDKSVNKKIALVGNMASEAYLGDYSGSPNKTVSPYEGIKAEFGADNVSFLGQPEASSAIMNINGLTFLDKNNNTVKTIDLSGATVTGGTLSGGKITGATSALSVEIANVDFDKVVNVRANIEVPEGSVGGILNVGYDSPTLVVSTIETAGAAAAATDYTSSYTGADGGYNGKGKKLYLTITPHSDFTIDKYSSYRQQLQDADIIIAYSSTMATGDKDSDGERTDCKESNDRTSIKLPKRDRDVIEKICDDFGEKTVVVSQSAGEMDFTAIKDKCRAILWTGYNGQTQGEALAKILSGEVNPSGKLSTTWYAPEDLKTMTVGGTKTNGLDTNGTTKIEWQRNNYGLSQKYDGESRTWQGRTYMYYGNAPQYPFGYGLSYNEYEYSNLRLDKASVSGGDKIIVSVDVENKGGKAGREVVQVYMKHTDADGINLPLQQLVGFKPVELDANEKKTVQLEVDTNTLSRWSEDNLKNYIPQGAYTLFAGKNVTDNTLTADVNIMGNPTRKIKTIYAVPSGIKVTGAYDKTTNTTAPIKTIDPSVSVYMTDETLYELTDGDITYTSSNNNIATVNDDGQIIAGTEEGAALITASVTINGETKTTSFPVVTGLQAAIPTAVRTQYLEELNSEYAKYKESDYRADFWSRLTEIYEAAKEKIQTEPDLNVLDKLLADAADGMAAIRDRLKPNEKAYTVTFKENLYYWNAEADIVYNADEDDPKAKVITAVYGEDKALKNVTIRDCTANITDNDSISLDRLDEGDVVRCYIWDSTEGMTPLADAAAATIVKPPKTVVYDLSEAKYDALSTLAAGDAFQPINGVGGYGDMTRITGVNYTASYNGKTYTLTGGFQGTKGSATKSNIYFVPFDCYTKATVTIFYDSAADDRKATFVQNGTVLGAKGGTGNKQINTLTVNVTDLTKPVYFIPEGQKVSAYMIVVDYE